MKPFIKDNFITLLPILFVIALTCYFIIVIVKFPLVGIEVKQDNNFWIVEKVYENGWASSQPIEEGDILQLVDEKKPEKHSTLVLFNRVEMAKSVTIKDKDSRDKTFTVCSVPNLAGFIYSNDNIIEFFPISAKERGSVSKNSNLFFINNWS
jgi:two-component system, NarL family, sensor histidine kinase ComP